MAWKAALALALLVAGCLGPTVPAPIGPDATGAATTGTGPGATSSQGSGVRYALDITEANGQPNRTVQPGTAVPFNLTFGNAGTRNGTANVTIPGLPAGWAAFCRPGEGSTLPCPDAMEIPVPSRGRSALQVWLVAPANATVGEVASLLVRATILEAPHVAASLALEARVRAQG